MASAYLETNSSETDSSTKLACTFFGPMQTQNQSASGTQADACLVKVTIEFADEEKTALLQQMPIIAETMEAQAENLPTEAVASMHKERRMKEQLTQLTQTLSSILTAAIATEHYSGTQIAVSFSVVELDCDILQAAVNCASVAMLNSGLKMRFLPTAVCIMQQDSSVSCVDPTLRQLSNQGTFTQKVRLVFNVDTEELTYSSMEALRHDQMLDLAQMERLMGTGLSAARKLHALILQSQSEKSQTQQP